MKQGFTRMGAMSLILGLAACASVGASVPEPAADSSMSTQAPLSVFLVRHAEKLSGNDPALTADGISRAATLADLLADADIQQIHSSDYTRTLETAAPLAARLGLEVEHYDPRDLQGMAQRLKDTGGRHLVVGHSNTTPTLAGLLGGDPGESIVEATEYDRLYLVTTGANGETMTILLRYGQRSPLGDAS